MGRVLEKLDSTNFPKKYRTKLPVPPPIKIYNKFFMLYNFVRQIEV